MRPPSERLVLRRLAVFAGTFTMESASAILAGDETSSAAVVDGVVYVGSDDGRLYAFGARGGNFVKTILRLARDKEALNVVGDQTGAPTPAALIATVTGVVLAMLRQGRAMEGDSGGSPWLMRCSCSASCSRDCSLSR